MSPQCIVNVDRVLGCALDIDVVTMKHKSPQDRRCVSVVALEIEKFGFVFVDMFAMDGF